MNCCDYVEFLRFENAAYNMFEVFKNASKLLSDSEAILRYPVPQDTHKRVCSEMFQNSICFEKSNING